jgi:uncharacterized RDD family membrane protein YckC
VARGAPRTLRRSFVTPEGVDLQLELGTAGARAAAFLIDAILLVVMLVVVTIAVVQLLRATSSELLMILWLIGFFFIRNGWFVLWELGKRGATPGKRVIGLRVVARDGARLTAGAVLARNAVREVEVFLPLSFLGYQASRSAADGWLVLFALLWSGIFLFFPLFNRDRLRVGDLIAGTWVVKAVRARLAPDLTAEPVRAQRVFGEAALDLYGEYELQTLEEVLRVGRPEALATVAAMIRAKAGLADDGDDVGFLHDYYAALCARLERGIMLGRRRADKHAGYARV